MVFSFEQAPYAPTMRPVSQSVTTDQPIYLVASRRTKLRPEAVSLRDWLIAEARMVALP